jgi:hypothetical protein
MNQSLIRIWNRKLFLCDSSCGESRPEMEKEVVVEPGAVRDGGEGAITVLTSRLAPTVVIATMS